MVGDYTMITTLLIATLQIAKELSAMVGDDVTDVVLQIAREFCSNFCFLFFSFYLTLHLAVWFLRVFKASFTLAKAVIGRGATGVAT